MNYINWCHFISTKNLNPWPPVPPSHVVIYIQFSGCSDEMELFKYHPGACGHLTGFRNKSQQTEQNSLVKFHRKYDNYLTQLLVNLYSYLSRDGGIKVSLMVVYNMYMHMGTSFSQIQSHVHRSRSSYGTSF